MLVHAGLFSPAKDICYLLHSLHRLTLKKPDLHLKQVALVQSQDRRAGLGIIQVKVSDQADD
jgi:hypothetical protein